jgi:DNA polymerase I
MTFPNPSFTQLQEYNVKDCCGTLELLEVLRPHLCNVRAGTYELSCALQAPILSMTLRGVRVNLTKLGEEKENLRVQFDHVRSQLEFIVHELTGRPFNPGSWQQLRWFLFDCLGAKPVILPKKGEKKISTDREALEIMKERDVHIEPFIDLMLLWRDLDATRKFLNTGIDPDGRIRSFFSISGTVTGRLSSSENAFGRGGNLQNITEDLRHLFIADPGYILLNVDLSQADSWNVGLETYQYTGDSSYLDAILSGDLHTTVTRLVWPELPWTGDIKLDRAIAERPFYRHHDYRYMSKKAGHGSNYLGKPFTIARQMKVPKALVELFQEKYFGQFPGIRPWQQARISELQLNKYLVSLLSRKRPFHGRLQDEKTWRDAIGFLGQSPTADVINLVTLALHRHCPEAELLLQVHDSLLMQIPEALAEEVVPKVLSLFRIPITVTSPSGEVRTYAIPADAAFGWNWGKRWKKLPDGTKIDHNPDGLQEWRGSLEARKRRYDPETSILDRCLS